MRLSILVSDIGSLKRWIWFRNLRSLFVEYICDMVCKVYVGIYCLFFPDCIIAELDFQDIDLVTWFVIFLAFVVIVV